MKMACQGFVYCWYIYSDICYTKYYGRGGIVAWEKNKKWRVWEKNEKEEEKWRKITLKIGKGP